MHLLYRGCKGFAELQCYAMPCHQILQMYLRYARRQSFIPLEQRSLLDLDTAALRDLGLWHNDAEDAVLQ